MYTPSVRCPEHPGTSARFVAPDAVFGALDGRHVVALGRHWQVQVYSVFDRSGRRWIQLGLEGKQSYCVLLRLSAGDGVARAVDALVTWLATACAPNPSLTAA